MSAPAGSGITVAAQVAREKEVHNAVEGALKDLDEHVGQEGYRHLFDRALHILTAIDQAGFRIIRKPAKR
jgi:hypothetical protein